MEFWHWTAAFAVWLWVDCDLILLCGWQGGLVTGYVVSRMVWWLVMWLVGWFGDWLRGWQDGLVIGCLLIGWFGDWWLMCGGLVIDDWCVVGRMGWWLMIDVLWAEWASDWVCGWQDCLFGDCLCDLIAMMGWWLVACGWQDGLFGDRLCMVEYIVYFVIGCVCVVDMMVCLVIGCMWLTRWFVWGLVVCG